MAGAPFTAHLFAPAGFFKGLVHIAGVQKSTESQPPDINADIIVGEILHIFQGVVQHAVIHVQNAVGILVAGNIEGKIPGGGSLRVIGEGRISVIALGAQEGLQEGLYIHFGAEPELRGIGMVEHGLAAGFAVPLIGGIVDEDAGGVGVFILVKDLVHRRHLGVFQPVLLDQRLVNDQVLGVIKRIQGVGLLPAIDLADIHHIIRQLQ